MFTNNQNKFKCFSICAFLSVFLVAHTVEIPKVVKGKVFKGKLVLLQGNESGKQVPRELALEIHCGGTFFGRLFGKDTHYTIETEIKEEKVKLYGPLTIQESSGVLDFVFHNPKKKYVKKEFKAPNPHERWFVARASSKIVKVDKLIYASAKNEMATQATVVRTQRNLTMDAIEAKKQKPKLFEDYSVFYIKASRK